MVMLVFSNMDVKCFFLLFVFTRVEIISYESSPPLNIYPKKRWFHHHQWLFPPKKRGASHTPGGRTSLKKRGLYPHKSHEDWTIGGTSLEGKGVVLIPYKKNEVQIMRFPAKSQESK